MQIEQWSILHDAVKDVQYTKHPLGHFQLEVKAPEERHGTKMYYRLQAGKSEVKEVSFDPNSKRINKTDEK